MGSRRRGFGRVRRLPSGRYQAGYVGPDLNLHNALDTFHMREDAEAWLARERELTHSEAWRPPKVRDDLARLQPDTLERFAEAWLGSRTLKPRTYSLYRSLLGRRRGHLRHRASKARPASKSPRTSSSAAYPSHRPIDRPIRSFMISLVPPPIGVQRMSNQAWAMGYSVMYP